MSPIKHICTRVYPRTIQISLNSEICICYCKSAAFHKYGYVHRMNVRKYYESRLWVVFPVDKTRNSHKRKTNLGSNYHTIYDQIRVLACWYIHPINYRCTYLLTNLFLHWFRFRVNDISSFDSPSIPTQFLRNHNSLFPKLSGRNPKTFPHHADIFYVTFVCIQRRSVWRMDTNRVRSDNKIRKEVDHFISSYIRWTISNLTVQTWNYFLWNG